MVLDARAGGQNAEIELITEDNHDLKVVNAARVSMAKRAEKFITRDSDPKEIAERKESGMSLDDGLVSYLWKNNHWTPFGHSQFAFRVRINYTLWDAARWLMERGPGWRIVPLNNHYLGPKENCILIGSLYNWLRAISGREAMPPILTAQKRKAAMTLATLAPHSVLAAVGEQRRNELRMGRGVIEPQDESLLPVRERLATFRLRMPIFVARQWMRSNVGIVYNEVSRRYIDDYPHFWMPDEWRGKPEKGVKQGSSSDVTVDGIRVTPRGMDEGFFQPVSEVHHHNCTRAIDTYSDMIAGGVAPEQARISLTLSTMTELWMSAPLWAYARVIALRGTRYNLHAQKETRIFADAIESLLASQVGTEVLEELIGEVHKP